MLTENPLSHYFEKLYLSYEIGYTKPDERIYRFALEDASLNPEETLFVDDGLANAEAGKKFGMHAFSTGKRRRLERKIKKILKSLA